MKESSFKIAALVVVLSLALLVAVEAIWAVQTYRNMRSSYEIQIGSILEEAAWQYATPSIDDSTPINIGNIARFDALVSEGLRTSGLTTEYRVEVLSTTDTEPVVLMAMGNIEPESSVITVDKPLFPLILRLTVSDPHSSILGDMRRVLILQILSVAVLIFAFLYLLHTLFRAKEVDRIRRDLTHNITHELKTPIAAAQAATEALLAMPNITNDPIARNEYINISLGELRRLGGMVEEILRTSTEEFTTAELHIEECDIRSIVSDVRSSLNLRYSTREITWNINIEESCAVVADGFHLRGIISAVVDNAIKYSEDRPMITIGAMTRSGYTYIIIKDQGIGIPDSEQKRIFDKFYRVTKGDKYTTSGYGLGLFYAQSIVGRHHGNITVESTLGKGSRFTIKLPRYGW
ncbi:MAG: HAMP domain-containing histidine kinase [Alistipes sp.]|nr:HAMP domain-containing histidine kinase [Alistipes sp.]